MEIVEQRSCAWSGEDWNQFFQSNVHPVDNMRLVSKLSGAGIVTRTLEVPETEKLWFGIMNEDYIKIAQCLPSVNVSPYQPIVTLKIDGTSGADEQSSGVVVRWAPHPDANILAIPEWLGAGLCIFAGLVGMQQNPLGLMGVVFGILLFVLPRFRASWNFKREMQRAEEAFSTLEIPWDI